MYKSFLYGFSYPNMLKNKSKLKKNLLYMLYNFWVIVIFDAFVYKYLLNLVYYYLIFLISKNNLDNRRNLAEMLILH